jgi:hypothetical protein
MSSKIGHLKLLSQEEKKKSEKAWRNPVGIMHSIIKISRRRMTEKGAESLLKE